MKNLILLFEPQPCTALDRVFRRRSGFRHNQIPVLWYLKPKERLLGDFPEYGCCDFSPMDSPSRLVNLYKDGHARLW